MTTQKTTTTRPARAHDDADLIVPDGLTEDAPDEQLLDSNMVSVQRLTRDLKAAARTLTAGEARYLVALYYEMQEQRIRAAAQVRSSTQQQAPNALIGWMLDNYETLEGDIKRAMDAYTANTPLGRWARSITGIGPVLAGGLLAHIDISRAPSPSHLWSYAGLNPAMTWERGQKRPFNADLKKLCWLIGVSFIKSSTRTNSYYGPIYRARKEYEQQKNETGDYAEFAAAQLHAKNYGTTTIARSFYEKGQLPPAHIQARVQRYVVKMFLAHYHAVAYELQYQRAAPDVWVIEHGGHTDRVPVPNWPMATR